jgi:hypothetical protein
MKALASRMKKFRSKVKLILRDKMTDIPDKNIINLFISKHGH